MRYAFYSHGGSVNRGCEAIVQSLSAMIKKNQPDSTIKLYTLNLASDKEANLKNIDEYEEFKYIYHVTSTTLAQRAKIFFLSKRNDNSADEYLYSLSCKNPSLKLNDVYISVGGDNYNYGDGHMAAAMNRELKRLGKKTVLWGCSVGAEDLSEKKIIDLQSFDLIVTRESLTYETLLSHGINKNTVLFPDPAFTLEIDDSVKNDFNIRKKTVGLNVSALVSRRAIDKEKFFDNIVGFIDYILKTTDYDVLLVPHVVYSSEEGDQFVLGKIAQRIKSDRIRMLPDNYSAAQYKYFISQCDMFIGARTHSTIAAYSTCVPTLVIGYSIKSKGIAKDIFGTDEGYVLPTKAIDDTEKLNKAFDNLVKNQESIKNHLRSFMPDYIQKAKNSINALDTI